MGRVDTGVDDGQDRPGGAGRGVPGCRGTDQRQAPFGRWAVERVVGIECRVGRRVDLDVPDRRVGRECSLQRRGDLGRDTQTTDRETADRTLVPPAEPGCQLRDPVAAARSSTDQEIDGRPVSAGVGDDPMGRIRGPDTDRRGQRPDHEGGNAHEGKSAGMAPTHLMECAAAGPVRHTSRRS